MGCPYLPPSLPGEGVPGSVVVRCHDLLHPAGGEDSESVRLSTLTACVREHTVPVKDPPEDSE